MPEFRSLQNARPCSGFLLLCSGFPLRRVMDWNRGCGFALPERATSKIVLCSKLMNFVGVRVIAMGLGLVSGLGYGRWFPF